MGEIKLDIPFHNLATVSAASVPRMSHFFGLKFYIDPRDIGWEYGTH
jgi:hypothetical protein